MLLDTSIIIGTIILGCTDHCKQLWPIGNSDDGSCTYDIYGCTDPSVTNYDPVTVDDGSCQYPTTCGSITGVYISDIIHDRALSIGMIWTHQIVK